MYRKIRMNSKLTKDVLKHLTKSDIFDSINVMM